MVVARKEFMQRHIAARRDEVAIVLKPAGQLGAVRKLSIEISASAWELWLYEKYYPFARQIFACSTGQRVHEQRESKGEAMSDIGDVTLLSHVYKFVVKIEIVSMNLCS